MKSTAMLTARMSSSSFAVTPRAAGTPIFERVTVEPSGIAIKATVPTA